MSTEHAVLTYDGSGNEHYQFALPDLQRVTDEQQLCYNLPLRKDERAECNLNPYGGNKIEDIKPLTGNFTFSHFRNPTPECRPGKLKLTYTS